MAVKKKPAKASAPRVFAALSERALTDMRSAKKELAEKLLVHAPKRIQGFRALTAAVNPAPEYNVVGVGIGEELADGRATGIRALKVFVRTKYPKDQLTRQNLLPEKHAGYEIDVEETGLFRCLLRPRPALPASGQMPDPRVKIRPAQPGCSIGFRDPAGQFTMAGTFGALVKDAGALCILSNNHVLADENQLPLGSPIYQPGLLDDPHGGQIAELTRFVRLQPGTPNKVDCAIAKALKPALVSRDILYIGPPQGTAPAALDMLVHKFGRTTAYTAGRITSIDTDVSVNYETGTYTFEGQIIIVGLDGQPFSAAGDSGSAILERQSQKVVGLLFAGSNTHTIANHISDVLPALNVTLA